MTVGELSSLEALPLKVNVSWTPAGEFPEGTTGAFIVMLDNEEKATISAGEAYSYDVEIQEGGSHVFSVKPVMTDADGNVTEGTAAAETRTLHTSEIIFSETEFKMAPKGTKTVSYTWKGLPIPAEELKASESNGAEFTFADTKDGDTIIGGTLTIASQATEISEVTVEHTKDWMDSVTLKPEMPTMPTYKLTLANTGKEIFSEDEITLQVTMEGTKSDDVTEEAGIKFLKVKEDGSDELLAEVDGKAWTGKLEGGEYKLAAEATVSFLGEQYPIRTNEITVKVTAVEFVDGDLKFRIIQSGDGYAEEYVGQLKLLGFAYGKSSASPVVKAVDGRKVVVIGEIAFKGNEDLISITLPNSVAIIEKQAFMNCKNLATMTTTD